VSVTARPDRPEEGPAAEPGDPAEKPGDPAAEFERHRELLFAVAYRMLGSVADAEDAVQDSWLRWSAADRSGVSEPRAYLVRVVTTTSLDRLRSARARRETYVGPWLPEPILTGPDISEDVELAESVSVALLVVLETLTPLERAVFVLREVFGFPHAEIAAAVDRSEPGVRQLAKRARDHVRARRPRFPAGAEEHRRVLAEFSAAVLGGDLNRLMRVLAPDVALWTDGGGKVQAARRVVRGADKVGRFLVSVKDRGYSGVGIADMAVEMATVNGAPAALVSGPDGLLSVGLLEIAEGRITTVRLIANPDKLRALSEGRTLAR
jgi:RNA polymerase sigma-70 factor (TIGR02957 family)